MIRRVADALAKVLDRATYAITLARLSILDRLAGPSHETTTDRVIREQGGQLSKAEPGSGLQPQLNVKCSHCGTPMYADDLTWHFRFPTDSDAVMGALRGSLNVRRCPLCKTLGRVQVPVVALNPLTKQAIVATAGISEEEIRAQVAIGSQVVLVPGYDQIRSAVLEWVYHYLQPALTGLITGLIARVNPKELKEHLTPIHLRLLRMCADRELKVFVRLPDEVQAKIKAATRRDNLDEAIPVLLASQLAGTVHLLVRHLLNDAVEKRRLETLYAEILARLPRDAISDLTLQFFLEDCVPLAEVLDQPEQFLTAYFAEIVNAIVHAIAGRPNPRSPECAEFVQHAWKQSRQRPSAFDASLLPPSSTAPKFIRFEDLWDISAGNQRLAQQGTDIGTRLDAVREMMANLGFEERFVEALAVPIRIEIEEGEERAKTAKAFVASLRNDTLRRYSFNTSVAESTSIGFIAGRMVRNLAANAMLDSAVELARSLTDDALKSKDYVAAFSIGCSAISELNSALAWQGAGAIATLLAEEFRRPEVGKNLERAGAGLTVSFWNEVGNTLRYVHEYEKSLSAYEIARALLGAVPDEEERQARESLIAVNEGRVYRHLGRYGAALDCLTRRVADRPGDAEAFHGLALLYADINRFAEAAQEMDRALDVTSPVEQRERYARLLITRAMVCARLGRSKDAAADLERADRLTPRDSRFIRFQIAATAALYLDRTEVTGDLLDRAEIQLRTAIDDDTAQPTRGLAPLHVSTLATAFYALGTLLLGQNRMDELERFDRDRLRPFLGDRDKSIWPWELPYLKGRVERVFGSDEVAWSWFRAALDRLDAKLPSGDETAISVTWLADKDAFQLEIAELAVVLAEHGTIDPFELIRVYEFANGRALGARVTQWRATADFGEMVRRGLTEAAAARQREIVVLFFIDTKNFVRLVHLSSKDPIPRLLKTMAVPIERAVSIGRRFISAVTYANPVALDRLDRDLELWWSFASELGGALPSLSVGSDVCFLPGRSMTALPLHLLQLANGEMLIDQHPVTYAANLALLFANGAAAEQPVAARRLIVSVAKSNDGHDFCKRLEGEGARLGHQAHAVGIRADRLDGLDATTNAVIAALADCNEVFFLCHGTHGGRIKGYGICVSDGRDLPPPLLAVDDAPDFARFVLGWDDLEKLFLAPSLVVSIACSSGRIVHAPGGVRLGLEQALLSRGTQAIVSPLWDVEQASSLAWIDAFGSARQNTPQAPIADAHRAACLATRSAWGHPYFWAPFILTGSLTGDGHVQGTH